MANSPDPLKDLLESANKRSAMDMGNSTLLLDRLQTESRQRMAMDALYSKGSQDMMRTLMMRSQLLQAGNTMVVSPLTSGMGLPYNPLNPIDMFTKVLGLGTGYQNTRLQTRALMGPAGATAAGEFDTTGADRFAKSLQAIGASRTDALQTMQALVTMSRQISASMADATMSVMNFSKATGLDRGMVASAVGTAAIGSNMVLGQGTATQLFSNLQTLARGNNALILPTAQAVQGFREMSLQRGRAISYNAYGVDNATNLMSSFINMDPTVYGQRPDIAMRHLSQVQSAGQSIYLGLAMDIAARAGKPTDIASVMAAIQSGESWIVGPLSREMSSGGLRDLSALTGIDAPFLLKGGLGGGFTPSTSRDFKTYEELAQRFTSEQDQLRASAVMGGEVVGRPIGNGVAGAFNSLPTWAKYGAVGVAGGAATVGTVLSAKGIRRLFTKTLANRAAAKTAAGAAGKYIGQSYEDWLMEGAEVAAKTEGKRGLGGLVARGAAATGKFGKYGLKSAPFIGAAFGLYGAYDRGKDGDYFGASLELGSAIAAAFGPWGMGASIAIQGGLVARDFAKASDTEVEGEPVAAAGPPRLDMKALGPLPDSTSFKVAPWRYNLPDNIVQLTPQKDIFSGYGEEGRSRAEAIAAGMQQRGFMLGLSRKTDREGHSTLSTYALDPQTGRVRKDAAAITALNEVTDRVESQLQGSKPGTAGGASKELTQALTTLTQTLTTLNNTITSRAPTKENADRLGRLGLFQ